MPRYTDTDALINDVIERYCKDCERRKGIKNGKQKFIYDIGDAPCRACAIDDMKDELENAPTVDAVEVVRCKDCKYYLNSNEKCGLVGTRLRFYETDKVWTEDCFCAWGERRKDADK